MTAMARSAPRYDPRLVAAARRLDDATLPMAETCRRVGAYAEEIGLVRPSYVHLRRLIRPHRERAAAARAKRAALLKIARDAYVDVTVGRRLGPVDLQIRDVLNDPRFSGSEPQTPRGRYGRDDGDRPP